MKILVVVLPDICGGYGIGRNGRIAGIIRARKFWLRAGLPFPFQGMGRLDQEIVDAITASGDFMQI
jgi:hypothetical protein